MANSEKPKESKEQKESQKPVERPRPVVNDSYIDLGYHHTQKIDETLPKLKK